MPSRVPRPKRTRSVLLTLSALVLAAALGALPAGMSATAEEPAVILAAGDIASCGTSGDEATAGLLDQLQGRVTPLGDIVYDGGLLDHYERCYHPSWGRHKDRTSPVIGNHEYAATGASGYFDYFGAAAGERGKGYYSYELGSWHVVVLNSNCGRVGGCNAGTPQEQWLRADLAASSASCTVAMWHHPRFSSGAHGDVSSTQAMWRALWEHGVELLLVGHDHDYERFRPLSADGQPDDATGVRQIVVGTGGRSHTAITTAREHSEVRNADTFGILQVTLGDTGYDWRFHPVPGGSFTDTGSDSCHGAPPDGTRPSTEITSGPPAATAATDAVFEFTADEPSATFSCSVDGSLPESCTSPYQLAGLNVGAHRFSVVATDTAGNTDQTPAVWDWQVTSDSPAEVGTYEVAADSQVTGAAVDANRNYGSLPTLTVDGKPRTDGYLRFDVTGVTGTVTSARLRVWATNPTNNGPAVATTPAGWTEGTLTWNNRPAPGPVVADVGKVLRNQWVEYNVDGTVTGDGSYSFALIPQVDDGMDFSAREHADPNEAELVLTTTSGPPVEDTTPPETTITSGPATTTSSTSASFGFTSSEAGSTFGCALDGGTPADCSSPLNLTGLATGPHELTVTATDSAGNTDLSPAVWSWEVGDDPEPPPPPATQTFEAAADAHVVQGSPGVNFGAATSLVVDGSPRSEGYLRFDVAGVTGQVTSATLRLWVTNRTTNAPRVWTTADGWTESGLTWNNRPAAVVQVANLGAVPAGAWVDYDVTSAVAGNGGFSFTLRPDGGDGIVLTSREGSQDRRPQLVVSTR